MNLQVSVCCSAMHRPRAVAVSFWIFATVLCAYGNEPKQGDGRRNLKRFALNRSVVLTGSFLVKVDRPSRPTACKTIRCDGAWWCSTVDRYSGVRVHWSVWSLGVHTLACVRALYAVILHPPEQAGWRAGLLRCVDCTAPGSWGLAHPGLPVRLPLSSQSCVQCRPTDGLDRTAAVTCW